MTKVGKQNFTESHQNNKISYSTVYSSGFAARIDLQKYAEDSIHTVAAILKLYFYYLPVPLLLPIPSLVSQWQDAVQDKSEWHVRVILTLMTSQLARLFRR